MLICFSRVWLFVTLWTTAHQAFLSMGFFRQEYWSGLPCPPPRECWTLFPMEGLNPCLFMAPALAGRFFTTSATWKAQLAAKLLQSCPTLCDPTEGSPPGSPIPGIFQASTLEWVAISFYDEWKWKVKVKSLSCVRLFTIPWTAAYQAPPSMGFSRQE